MSTGGSGRGAPRSAAGEPGARSGLERALEPAGGRRLSLEPLLPGLEPGAGLLDGGVLEGGIAALVAVGASGAAAPGAAAAVGAAEAGGREVPDAGRGLKVLRRTMVLEVSKMTSEEDLVPLPPRLTTPPRTLQQPRPRYPAAAQKGDIEGSVWVRVLITDGGVVGRHEVVAAHPPGHFEKAVQEVLPQWRFAPARDETGKPMECWKEFRYEFKLEAAP
jgi:protein TonB